MTEPVYTNEDGDLTREGEAYVARIAQRRAEREDAPMGTPAQDQAVVLAKDQFEGWLRDNFDRDLNGRQRDLIARAALEVIYPLIKIALAHDYADNLEKAEPMAFAPVIQALRDSAEEFQREVARRALRV